MFCWSRLSLRSTWPRRRGGAQPESGRRDCPGSRSGAAGASPWSGLHSWQALLHRFQNFDLKLRPKYREPLFLPNWTLNKLQGHREVRCSVLTFAQILPAQKPLRLSAEEGGQGLTSRSLSSLSGWDGRWSSWGKTTDTDRHALRN